MQRITGLVVLTFLVVLLGCGGGNKFNLNVTQTTISAHAQGVYSATLPNQGVLQTIVLPDDSFYAIYGTTVNGTLVVEGYMSGQGTTANGTYTCPITNFYVNGNVVSGTLTVNFVVGVSFSGSIVLNGSTTFFSGTPIPLNNFNYNTPALLSDIVGTWSDHNTTTVTVDASGNFTGTASDCSFTGTVVPDTAKNFFRVTLTFGGSPCEKANQTLHGIAVDYLLSDGVTRQLIFGGSSGNAGVVFAGTK